MMTSMTTTKPVSWWRRPGGGGEVWRIAWPLIFTNSFVTLQLTLDRLFLSQHSSDEMAACMAGTMLFWTPIALLQFTASYCSAFVAQYKGAGQPEKIGPVVWQSIHFAVLAGLGFFGFLWLIDPLIAWVGHPSALRGLEARYLRCLTFAALPVMLTGATAGFFSGLGHSKTVLLVNAVGLVVNALLDYLLIFGRWGFPEMGIEGAGWATVAGCSVSALLGCVLFLGRKNARKYRTVAGWRFDLALMGRLLRYGIPNGVLVGMETLAFTLFLIFVGRIGIVELAGSTIAFTLNLPAYFPTMGIGQGVGVVVGQRLGAGEPEYARRAAWSGLWMALAFAGCVALFYLAIPGQLVGVFRDRNEPLEWGEVSALAVHLLGFVCVYCLFDAAALVFSFTLRGAGDTGFVSLATLCLSWPVMVIPTWLAWRLGWGVHVAWGFVSAFPVCLAVVLGWRFLRGHWQGMRVIEERKENEMGGEPAAVAAGSPVYER
jgi:MATE family multidrug resistance protein